jgi:hypothetical protein
MGLTVEVGFLADVIANDPDAAADGVRDFARIADALAEAGLEPYVEPNDCPVWSADLLGYSGLHALREVAGYVWRGHDIPRGILLDGSQTDQADALVKEFFEHLTGKGNFTLIGKAFRQIFKVKEKPKLPPFVHLLVHSDCDGFYVPVAFENPVVAKRVTSENEHLWPLGSVMRLEEEINQLARHLDIPADLRHDDAQLHALIDAPDRTPVSALWTAQPIATHTCLVLREACEHSLRTGAAIHFC